VSRLSEKLLLVPTAVDEAAVGARTALVLEVVAKEEPVVVVGVVRVAKLAPLAAPTRVAQKVTAHRVVRTLVHSVHSWTPKNVCSLKFRKSRKE